MAAHCVTAVRGELAKPGVLSNNATVSFYEHFFALTRTAGPLARVLILVL
jgi:hypothetical protein